MQYKILWIEQKEYEGRKYAKASIEGLDGTSFDEISLGDKWGEKLETLAPGHTVEGNVWQNPKNKKWSLYPVEDKKPRIEAYKRPQEAIREAQNMKREDINRTLDRKEESIALASAQRDAVLIVVELMKVNRAANDGFEGTVKEEIIKWRNWFLSDDFKGNIPPF